MHAWHGLCVAMATTIARGRAANAIRKNVSEERRHFLQRVPYQAIMCLHSTSATHLRE